jgi:hypothetical protein
MPCTRCGFALSPASRFCPSCGVATGIVVPADNQPRDVSFQPAIAYDHHLAKARGFGQIFGIHPAIAFLTLVVDMMLFGGELATLGAILPISIVSGLILGIIAYMAQRKWYGDDKDSAIIKALILAFLTAIPTPLPAILYVPSGIVGLIHKLRGK